METSTSRPKISIELPEVGNLHGGGAYSFYHDRVEEFAWATDLFSYAEMDTIINIGEAIQMDQARVASNITSPEVRDSSVAFIFPNGYTSWIFERLAGSIQDTNARFFGFDLSGLEQGLQITRYNEGGQHYDWHVDRGRTTGSRKLSVSIQLSDPDDYEGGNLVLKYGQTDTEIERKRGLVTFFPSFALHRVTPVTKGTRYSLVAWVSGPAWK